MLHMILAILKIVGILLAVLLLLIFLTICAALFVPLRYRVDAGKNGNEIEASGKVSWLFRLISVSGRYEDGKPALVMRILFLKKNLLGGKNQEDSQEPEENVQRKKKRPQKRQKIESGGSARKKPGDGGKLQKKRQADGEEKRQKESRQKESRPDSEERRPNGRKPSKEEGLTETRKQKERKTEKSESAFRKISKKIKGIYKGLIEIPQSIKRVIGKLGQLKGKCSEFLQLIKSEEVKRVCGRCWQHLQYLWKHLRPKQIQGEVRYGFDDPSVTGQLTGVFYLLMAGKRYSLLLQPDFEERICEGDIRVKGHIRIWHIARVAWSVFRDKELRSIIKNFKS